MYVHYKTRSDLLGGTRNFNLNEGAMMVHALLSAVALLLLGDSHVYQAAADNKCCAAEGGTQCAAASWNNASQCTAASPCKEQPGAPTTS